MIFLIGLLFLVGYCVNEVKNTFDPTGGDINIDDNCLEDSSFTGKWEKNVDADIPEILFLKVAIKQNVYLQTKKKTKLDVHVLITIVIQVPLILPLWI